MRRFATVMVVSVVEKMSDKILVTGAAGFIGFHVAQRLLQAGRSVVGLDSINDYYDPTLKDARLSLLKNDPNFDFIKLDLADRAEMKALFAKHRFLLSFISPHRPVFVIRSIIRTLTSTPILKVLRMC